MNTRESRHPALAALGPGFPRTQLSGFALLVGHAPRDFIVSVEAAVRVSLAFSRGLRSRQAGDASSPEPAAAVASGFLAAEFEGPPGRF